jgi:hypothetical protein
LEAPEDLNAVIGSTVTALFRMSRLGQSRRSDRPPVSLLPTAPELKDKVFIKDDVWWKDNLVKVTQRFKEWQLAG